MVDEQHLKMTKVNQVVKNQLEIIGKLNTLVEEETKVSFPALKKKYHKDWRANRTALLKDTSMRITAGVRGKDVDSFLQEQKDKLEQIRIKGQKNRKWVVAAIIIVVAYKKFF